MTGTAEQPIEFLDVPLRHLQGVGPQPVEQPHLLESVCAGGDLLGAPRSAVRADSSRRLRRIDSSAVNAECALRIRLRSVNCRSSTVRSRSRPLRLDSSRGQFGGRV